MKFKTFQCEYFELEHGECDDYVRTFKGATSFTGDGVSNWDTSSVTTLT